MRIEDLDPPRESPAAARDILKALEQLQLHWDGAVLYQSSRSAAYDEALAELSRQQNLYPCTCSRQDLEAASGNYPGTCRQQTLPLQQQNQQQDRPYALRCRIDTPLISYDDLFQGRQQHNLQQEGGDFILRRKDGFHAYQLAVVVDDAWQGITHVIRGIDLLDSCPRHLYLQSLLGLPSPHYGHFPVLVNPLGQKLSKQNHAPALALDQPARLLVQTLAYLQQQPPRELLTASVPEVLDWAIANWQRSPLQGMRSISEAGDPDPA